MAPARRDHGATSKPAAVKVCLPAGFVSQARNASAAARSAKLERLDALLRKEPAQAKAEIAKHSTGN
jgi:hypothetical protein